MVIFDYVWSTIEHLSIFHSSSVLAINPCFEGLLYLSGLNLPDRFRIPLMHQPRKRPEERFSIRRAGAMERDLNGGAHEVGHSRRRRVAPERRGAGAQPEERVSRREVR